MAVVSGTKGSVVFTNGYQTKVTAWTINAATEEVDTSALGEAWKSFIPGISEWSGTYNCLADEGGLAAGALTATANKLQFGMAPASATFSFDTTGAVGGALSGTIMVTGADFGSQTAGGANTLDITFRGSGTLSLAT